MLPAAIRRQDGIESGQEFEIERLDCGEYRLMRKKTGPQKGLVDLLLSCPSKDWFVSINSESTDTL